MPQPGPLTTSEPPTCFQPSDRVQGRLHVSILLRPAQHVANEQREDDRADLRDERLGPRIKDPLQLGRLRLELANE
eukprot:15276491-Alexandrium_andersonii.AAC.1